MALGPERNRIVAIRTSPGAEAGANALYFMDLARSVETIIFARRRVDVADWSADGTFIVYSALVPATTQEDLFYSLPNGGSEQNLTESVDVRELNARIDPFSRTVVYEKIDAAGVSRISLFPDTQLTSGPADGPELPDTPYVVGADADPVFSPDGRVDRVPPPDRGRQRRTRHVGPAHPEGRRRLAAEGDRLGRPLPWGAGLGREAASSTSRRTPRPPGRSSCSSRPTAPAAPSSGRRTRPTAWPSPRWLPGS